MEYRKLNYSTDKGFSLIEILVVLIIIGILAGISINSLGRTMHYSEDKEFKSILYFIESNIEHTLISGETIKLDINEDTISVTKNNDKIDEMKLNAFKLGIENVENNEIDNRFSLTINQLNLLKKIEFFTISDSQKNKLNLSMNGLEIKDSE